MTKKIVDDIYMISKNEDLERLMPMKKSIYSVTLKLYQKEAKQKKLTKKIESTFQSLKDTSFKIREIVPEKDREYLLLAVDKNLEVEVCDDDSIDSAYPCVALETKSDSYYFIELIDCKKEDSVYKNMDYAISIVKNKEIGSGSLSRYAHFDLSRSIPSRYDSISGTNEDLSEDKTHWTPRKLEKNIPVKELKAYYPILLASNCLAKKALKFLEDKYQ